jgi:DNA-directed RNA polymerase specialized sigma24 family protein
MTHPLSAEQFEALLRLLGPDPESAGACYVQLRRRLISVFRYRQCANPEDLADETMDRVARKLQEQTLRTELRDPSAVVFGVAWNIAKESFRRPRTLALPDEWDPGETMGNEDQLDTKEQEQACLDRCLTALPSSERDLVLRYFHGEKQAKIRDRSMLTKQLHITPNALRLRIHRITAGLRDCVFECMDTRGAGVSGLRSVEIRG